MPLGEDRHEREPGPTLAAATPWLTTGLTTLLLAAGFGRNPAARRGEASSDADGSDAAGRESRSRGRSATTPSQIPATGWKDVLLRSYNNISEDRIVAIAAGVTFYTILAIFPALAALVSIYGLFADPATIASVLQSLSGVLPAGALDIIGDEMRNLTAQPPATLGLTFLVSLTLSLWSANSGIKAIFDALNVVYHEREKRGFFKLNALSLAFTLATLTGGVLLIAIVAVLPVALDHLGSYFGLHDETALLIKLLRWPVLLVLIAAAIAVIYRYGPSREAAQWRWLTLGSLSAAVVWVAASMLFSWYATNFAKYNQTYGSLGAAIVFMTWIWISCIVILLGAELDAETEHQTARDTTTGRPQPLGKRGARMADTVGAPQH